MADNEYVAEKMPLENVVITNRGYQGGTEMDELIGAKKVPTPGNLDKMQSGKGLHKKY